MALQIAKITGVHLMATLLDAHGRCTTRDVPEDRYSETLKGFLTIQVCTLFLLYAVLQVQCSTRSPKAEHTK